MANTQDIENIIKANARDQGNGTWSMADQDITNAANDILNLTPTTDQGLRDYFAGVAMLTLPKEQTANYNDKAAAWCYYVADEMLGAR